MPRSTLTDTLNPEQREAVLHTDGPLLVVAGAGSGKTTVITRRIARLIAERHAAPNEILGVTFTNKAAAEMRTRVAKLTGGDGAKRVMLSTFHSFCLGVLREHIERLGYRANFSISSEGDAQTLLRRVLSDLDGMKESLSPGMLRERISLMKGREDEGGGDEPEPDGDDKYRTWFPEVYQRYESALRAANALDFDDLLRFTVKLWREHPDVLEQYRGRFRYVLVDEYQDTNAIQYGLLRQLVDEHKNICVVGDDDQAIYGWRGADVRNILRFDRDFPGTKTVILHRNYRSRATILAAANGVISQNSERRPKNLTAEAGKGRPIDLHIVGDEEQEAFMVRAWIERIRTKTACDFNDFAVLYRSNTQSRPIEIALRRAAIPYVVYGGQEFFERAEVRDIIAYLKLLANPRDEASFLRVVNMPRRGIGDATLHTIHDVCRTQGLSLGRAMAEALRAGRITGPAAEGVRSFLGLMQRYRDRLKARSERLSETLRALVGDIAYRDELERTSKRPEQALFRWENVEAVLQAVEAYETNGANPSLRGFLDESALNTDADRRAGKREREDAVSLMTIHSAKGLEFPFVFITGVEEGLLPHDRSVRDGAIEEERRLFYVALTRAKRHVALFQALTRTIRGRDRATAPSRFLREIPVELIRNEVYAAPEAMAPPTSAAKKPRKTKRTTR